ncbi:hypothetical protein AB1Y20_006281 [Prymnesium parvum]|uniref:DUF659 domain-containing protein n=1 Tax=Prymnesium parvum TaxID=97485 RepID=A0AB34J1F3_PRYPA
MPTARTHAQLLASGTPLSVCDKFRPLLQRAGFALTDSSHLKVFIPRIEETEVKRLKKELDGQYISISFDGTTRLGEAICCTTRWCSATFELEKRLLDVTTVEKHVDHKGLATHLADLVQRRRGIAASKMIGITRDSASTNGAACGRLLGIFSNAVDLLCCCHTLNNMGERIDLPTLREFRTPWLELVGGRNPHAGAKILWKSAVAPASVPGFSNVRWHSWAEITFVIAEAGMPCLGDFIRKLNEYEYGSATRAQLTNIYNTKSDRLRLELAAMCDMRILVRTTYELEGDRLEILLAYDRIQVLRSMGESIKSMADGVLPNVDACLRYFMELKRGVKIRKYFADHGVCDGFLETKERVDSTLYPGQERDAWLVTYEDGHQEHFEEEELRSGKDGATPAQGDGKPLYRATTVVTTLLHWRML